MRWTAAWCIGASRPAFAWLLAFAALSAGCTGRSPTPLQGYVEGEFVLVASPYGGTLARLSVARGDPVRQGDALFRIEDSLEQAAVDEAKARIEAAQARIENLSSARRAAEIEALREQVAAARASLGLSEETLAQQRRLRARGFVSPAGLDAAQAARDRDAAQLAQAQAQVRNAETSIGREPEIAAARAELEAARAAYEQAATRVEQKAAKATSDATVADTFFRVGESVPAGAPVVSLLPPQNVKLRFFVPQAQVGTLRIGDAVRARCDGCEMPIDARIVFVAPRAEYTPPVIYGENARQKLVFLVEARPSPTAAARMHPGQPVDVEVLETPHGGERR
ncbi:MAG: HlyD family efflux transporter periplasmic adaptor subunit [Burkholderiaceae bacterium]|nr:HlyD family efflux transporter periplasmic adaptor subunit [Burkholderiaceae bacterium]